MMDGVLDDHVESWYLTGARTAAGGGGGSAPTWSTSRSARSGSSRRPGWTHDPVARARRRWRQDRVGGRRLARSCSTRRRSPSTTSTPRVGRSSTWRCCSRDARRPRSPGRGPICRHASSCRSTRSTATSRSGSCRPCSPRRRPATTSSRSGASTSTGSAAAPSSAVTPSSGRSTCATSTRSGSSRSPTRRSPASTCCSPSTPSRASSRRS